ncbi:hypothetical protein Acr_00g0098550 [Actinidia rufa]|uniref:Uncharacterized protein n=1 Tax=Actinidia rufa TaxID=165716 RepID=A0A7J0DZL4_9ERIC|nr:hypothetical protein Acr_00g0098550 [Actinidia rufa]
MKKKIERSVQMKSENPSPPPRYASLRSAAPRSRTRCATLTGDDSDLVVIAVAMSFKVVWKLVLALVPGGRG